MSATTPAGRSIVRRLTEEERTAAMRADEDEMHTYARIAAKAERDLLRRLLRWVPEEVERTEVEAVRIHERTDELLAQLIESVP